MDDVLKQSAIGQDVTLAVGDTLKLTLGSNHTTPFHWTADAKIGDPSMALKAGTTTIVTDYTSIVGSDPMPACTFTARVTVQ